MIGSRRLNQRGLHRARVRIAGALASWRRARLAKYVRADWRETFDRDGFVAIEGIVPEAEFAGLREAILGYEGEAREMIQGDAITRRMAVDPAMLEAIPALRTLLRRQDVRALFHYAASFRIEPLHYIQTIVTHANGVPDGDPQEALHADAFHSSLKAWLFLNPVAADEAPFTYVPGSHRLTPQRLDWEYRRSLADPRTIDRLSARGSPRARPTDLVEMELPGAAALAVSANTLVVADMIGFHARGGSVKPVERVEVWSYARRNPFLPWISGDLLSVPGLAERRVGWLWAARDALERVVGQPWRRVGLRTPNSQPQNCAAMRDRRISSPQKL
ncbi:phytanoyl-CoA dioxygenase family protein [Novosphingobium sp. Rr 2-17]|uniref:phytanoyl-CoA dioxygenase family protein n=1 Tax=Novosphingobium sp. Rr 2-17 TaxID=555793 RepID=UPI003FD0A9EA